MPIRLAAAALLLALSTCAGSPAMAAELRGPTSTSVPAPRALRGLARVAAVGESYAATVVRISDGDTLVLAIPAWSATPFGTMRIRVSGIDTPESRKPPAKCKAEVALGKAPTAYAETLVQPGDAVTLIVRGADRYFRLDGLITLPDRRDWAAVILEARPVIARPYSGGKKSSWCRKVAVPPARPVL